jgi:hypothetical protein
MARAIRKIGHILVALAQLYPLAASAQETPDQFNAANAENQRFYEAQNKLRNQAHDLRNDRARGLLQCQGAGSGAAQNACANNLDIDLRQRGLDLNNQRIQEQNNHSLILKGIGVHRVP